MSSSDDHFDFDFIVIGSGFGGSVSAHRLIDKGYRVAVMEMGRRWSPESLPHSSWSIHRWFWRPKLGLRGFFNIQCAHKVEDLIVLVNDGPVQIPNVQRLALQREHGLSVWVTATGDRTRVTGGAIAYEVERFVAAQFGQDDAIRLHAKAGFEQLLRGHAR